MRHIKLFEKYSELLDNPTKACVLQPGYKDIVRKVRDANIKDVPQLIENWFLKNESDMADVILEPGANYLYCEHGSDIVGKIMGDAGIPHQKEVGIINGQSHAWARTGTGLIIDPTKDQFSGIKEDDYNNAKDLTIFNWDGEKYIQEK